MGRRSKDEIEAEKAMKAAMRAQKAIEKEQAAIVKQQMKEEVAAMRQAKKDEAQRAKLAAAAIREQKKQERKKEADDKWAKTLKRVYVADFETTTHINFVKEGRVRVFAWGLMSLDGSEYLSGDSIETFMWEVEKRPNAIVVFHNLAFDGTFIETYLLEVGFKFRTFQEMRKLKAQVEDLRESLDMDPENSKLKNELKEVQQKVYFLENEQFSTIRDKTNNVFSIDVGFGFGNTAKFLDSLKWFPGKSISKLGSLVGVPKMTGDFDFTVYRAPGYVLTDSEEKYLYHDVLILQKVVKQHLEKEGRIKLTRTSYAFSAMVAKYNEGKKGEELFKSKFPATDVATWKYLKPAYNGGLTLVMPGQDNKKIVSKGYTLDFNSLYPYVMLSKKLPYGIGKRFSGRYEDSSFDTSVYDLYVVEFKAKFTLKDGMIPSLAKTFTFSSKSVLSDADIESDTLFLTNVDIEHMYKNYDVHSFEAIGGMAWRSVDAPFDGYIEQEMDAKVEAGKAGRKLDREFHKLNANGCYGYLGKSIHNSMKDSELDEEGKLTFVEHLEDESPQQYLPAAIFITAWARHELLTAGYEIIKTPGLTLCYMDTDSLHYTGDHIPAGLWVDSHEIGALSIDAQWDEAKFMRAKLYVEALTDSDFKPLFVEKLDENGQKKTVIFEGQPKRLLDVKGAGLTDEAKSHIHTIDHMKYNVEFPGCKSKKIVPGGTMIVDGTKKLSDHRKPLPDFEDLLKSMEDDINRFTE